MGPKFAWACLLLLPLNGWADAIVRSTAMFADTIAEYYVEDDHVRLELEIGESDIASFRNLLPDSIYRQLGFGDAPVAFRGLPPAPGTGQVTAEAIQVAVRTQHPWRSQQGAVKARWPGRPGTTPLDCQSSSSRLSWSAGSSVELKLSHSASTWVPSWSWL